MSTNYTSHIGWSENFVYLCINNSSKINIIYHDSNLWYIIIDIHNIDLTSNENENIKLPILKVINKCALFLFMHTYIIETICTRSNTLGIFSILPFLFFNFFSNDFFISNLRVVTVPVKFYFYYDFC